MKNSCNVAVILFIVLLILTTRASAQNTIVEKYGQLSVNGNFIQSEHGDTVQLRGMSLFWSQWMSQYYTTETVAWLADDWKCTVVRAAMGVEMNGYLTSPDDEKSKVMKVVDAAIKEGIYVIIDFHSHEAHKHRDEARQFFSEMAEKYGSYPNVLYEIYNEPVQNTSWSNVIKPYADSVIKSIRVYDPDNIVIVGSRQWSQLVLEAAEDRIQDPNVVYSLHFYAASHGAYLRDEAEAAMAKGIAVFVTEFGTTEYTGDGEVGYQQTREWLDFMDTYKISWCNWSVSDKNETSAVLITETPSSNWGSFQITPSGYFIRKEIIRKNRLLLKKVKSSKC